MQTKLLWVENVTYPQGAQNYQFDVFDHAWQEKLHAQVLRECRVFANDPFVLGVVADSHYSQLKAAVREGAPKHLFIGLLKSTKEGNGTLLDQTSLLISSNLFQTTSVWTILTLCYRCNKATPVAGR